MDTNMIGLAMALGIEWRPEMGTPISAPERLSKKDLGFWLGKKIPISPEAKIIKAAVALQNRRNWVKENLTAIDRLEAQRLADIGMSYTDLAKHYNCSKGRIQNLHLVYDPNKTAEKIRQKKLGKKRPFARRMRRAA